MDFKLLGLCALVVLGISAVLSAIVGAMLASVLAAFGLVSPLWCIPMIVVVMGYFTLVLYAKMLGAKW